MQTSVASVSIRGITAYSQSRQHDDPKLDGEGIGDHDIRTWRSKLSVEQRDGRSVVVIPAHGIHQAIAAAAKYSKRQIPGQGKATWTAKFTAGITLLENVPLVEDPLAKTPRLIDPAEIRSVTISANSDGVRGSGKRVPRRFPQIPPPWGANFDVHILDSIITEDIFREMVEIAGMFIGLGRFRPEKGGTNGRFAIAQLAWADNRRLAA